MKRPTLPARLLFAALLALGTAACGGTAPERAGEAPAEAPSARMEAHLDALDVLAHELLDVGYTVGVVVAVVDGDEVAYRSFGAVSAESGAATPTPDTVFEVGSVTKPFTAILLADLAHAGLVSVDDTIGRWLAVPVPAGDEITLLELATHTSGLPRVGTNFEPADPDDPYVDYDEADTLAFLTSFAPPAPTDAGATWEYSNLGFGLLGQVLANSQGTDYEALLAARVLGPLGLSDTAITLSASQRGRLAQGHGLTGRPLPHWDNGSLAGCFALRSTARDLVRFVRANLAAPAGPLGPALADAPTPRVDTPLDPWRNGLAWFVSPDGALAWHDGGTGGFYAFVGFDRDRQFGLVWLSNSSLWRVTALADRLREVLQGLPPQPLGLRPTVEVPLETLGDYVGQYTSPELQGLVFEVGLDRGSLTFGVVGMEGGSLLLAETDSRFFLLEDDSVTFSFERDAQGRVDAMVVERGGEGSRIPRMAPDPSAE